MSTTKIKDCEIWGEGEDKYFQFNKQLFILPCEWAPISKNIRKCFAITRSHAKFSLFLFKSRKIPKLTLTGNGHRSLLRKALDCMTCGSDLWARGQRRKHLSVGSCPHWSTGQGGPKNVKTSALWDCKGVRTFRCPLHSDRGG